MVGLDDESVSFARLRIRGLRHRTGLHRPRATEDVDGVQRRPRRPTGVELVEQELGRSADGARRFLEAGQHRRGEQREDVMRCHRW